MARARHSGAEVHGSFSDWFRDLVRVFDLMQYSAAKHAEGVTLLGEHRFHDGYTSRDWRASATEASAQLRAAEGSVPSGQPKDLSCLGYERLVSAWRLRPGPDELSCTGSGVVAGVFSRPCRGVDLHADPYGSFLLPVLCQHSHRSSRGGSSRNDGSLQ